MMLHNVMKISKKGNQRMDDNEEDVTLPFPWFPYFPERAQRGK